MPGIPSGLQLHFAEGASDGFSHLTWVIPLGNAELGFEPVLLTPKPVNDPSSTPCLSAPGRSCWTSTQMDWLVKMWPSR